MEAYAVVNYSFHDELVLIEAYAVVNYSFHDELSTGTVL